MSKQLVCSSLLTLTLVIALLFQYKELNSIRRNSLWLLILGFSVLSAALFFDENVHPFFHYSIYHILLAVLPAIGYASCREYKDSTSFKGSVGSTPSLGLWSDSTSIADKFWYSLMIACLFVFTFGTMLVAALFLPPLILAVPNSNSRDSLGSFVDVIALFGGMGLGFFLGLFCASFISRKFISAETHAHWAKFFREQVSSFPPFLRRCANYINGFMLPREKSSA